MQKLIWIQDSNVNKVNQELEYGWEIKMIVPYNQPVSRGEGYASSYGEYGAYVVLEK